MQQNVATAVVDVNLLAYLRIRKKGTVQTEQFCRVTQADVRATVQSLYPWHDPVVLERLVFS